MKHILKFKCFMTVVILLKTIYCTYNVYVLTFKSSKIPNSDPVMIRIYNCTLRLK